MRKSAMAAAAMIATLGLGACSTGTALDDVGTLWGDDSTTEQAKKVERVEALQATVPIQAVRTVEMGRTRNGFIITAFGTAPGVGYSLPSLRARRGGLPGTDGYIEFDFVAVEPPAGFNLPQGTTQARAVRADLPVPLASLQGAAGLRVIALGGGVQMDF